MHKVLNKITAFVKLQSDCCFCSINVEVLKQKKRRSVKGETNIWNQSVRKRVMAGWRNGESRRGEERTERGENIDKKEVK